MRHIKRETVCTALAALLLLFGKAAPTWSAEQVARQGGSPAGDYATAAEKVLPAVVKIEAMVKPLGDVGGLAFPGFSGGEPPSPAVPGGPPLPPHPVPSHGSGVIIEPNGIIVTCNHVVERADKLVVELADGRELKVTEIKSDRPTDLAILRVEVDEPLPAARFGDSQKLRIGEPVIAVGCPAGLPPSVSAGIISGKGRQLPSAPRVTFLQTDAAINPGSAGGPLANLDGEVIGINAATLMGRGGFHGVGFAVPSNLVKHVVAQLAERGKVQRAFLGLVLSPHDPETPAEPGPNGLRGVQVMRVFADSPAAKAAVQVGDVIVRFSGQPVRGARGLQKLVEICPVDSTHKVEVLRDGESHVLEVTLKPLPDDFGPPQVPEKE